MVHLTSIFDSEGYDTLMPWPESVQKLQYGRDGIVFNKETSYKTAFFEAFMPNIFARGEGKSVEEAERNAYTSLKEQMVCQHDYIPFGFDKSSGKCNKCNHVEPNMFPSNKFCKVCNKPHVRFCIGKESFCIEHFANKENVDKQPESVFFSKEISYALSDIAEVGLKHKIFTEDENKNSIIFNELHDKELSLQRELHNNLIKWISLNVKNKKELNKYYDKVDQLMTFYHKDICELIFSNNSINIIFLIFNKIVEEIK